MPALRRVFQKRRVGRAMKMKKDEFYKMVSELDTAISFQSCGCMGSNYTPERAQEEFERATIKHYLKPIFEKYIELE